MTAVLFCPSDDVRDMARALGLDPKTVSALTIRFRPGEVVTAHVRLVLTPAQGEELKTIWRRYALMRLDEKP